ncbi:hypothetical protein FRB90_006130 [Tulasnella sp. 427]|nr:hypothetical protein FRB90_006130 [Tulasnella sp. 427]
MSSDQTMMIATDLWAGGLEHPVGIERLLDEGDIWLAIDLLRASLFYRGELHENVVSRNIIKVTERALNSALRVPGAETIDGKQYIVRQGRSHFTYTITDVGDLEKYAGETPTFTFDRIQVADHDFNSVNYVVAESIGRVKLLQDLCAAAPYHNDYYRRRTTVISPISSLRFAVKDFSRTRWRIEDRLRQTWFYFEKTASSARNAGEWVQHEYAEYANCKHLDPLPRGRCELKIDFDGEKGLGEILRDSTKFVIPVNPYTRRPVRDPYVDDDEAYRFDEIDLDIKRYMRCVLPYFASLPSSLPIDSETDYYESSVDSDSSV